MYNTRTHESFATIQAAIDDVDTIDGDILTLNEGTYTENVLVNKRLTIQPVTGANVTVEAKDSDKSVFVINNEGSGSTIRGLNIISSENSYGISLSHSYNNNIINNTISNGNRGIYLYISGNNVITENIITGGYYGIVLYNSTSNILSGNTVKYNENGVYLFESNYNTINGNTISDNYYGSYFYHSNNNNVTENNFRGNWAGIYLYDTNNNSITGNNLTDNGAGITYYNSLSTTISGNSFTDNWLTDTATIDSGKMVMATTTYSCGPAALATILKSLGIYTTEVEIAKLAGTDETGTSLYGLKTAAQNKGTTAIGARLTLDQLKTNYIVVLTINDVNYFEVVQNITNTTVYLFDPNLGNIEMSITKFNELYTGVAFLINEQPPGNVTILTDDEMKNIKGNWHTIAIQHYYWTPGYFYVTWKRVTVSFSVPYVYLTWVPTFNLGQIHLGYYAAHIGWYRVSYGFSIPIIHYVPGHKVYYTTYIKVIDYKDVPKVRPSYEWKGTAIVKKRVYYSKNIVAGSVGVYSTLLAPLAGKYGIIGLSGGLFGIDSLWTGLNDYAAHLNEVGSQGWIDPK